MPSIYAHAVDFSSETVTANDVVKEVSVWLCMFLLMAYGGSLVYAIAQSRNSEPALQATKLAENFALEKESERSWNRLLAQSATEVALMERTLIESPEQEKTERPWSVSQSVWILAGSSVLIAFLSEFVSDCVDSITTSLGWTEIFVGAIVIGVIGNVGALMSAVLVAFRNKMDLSFEIGMNASSQIALLVIPVLIIASNLVGQPVDFLFSPPQIAALLGGVLIMTQISQDGRCNWLNGLQMLIFFGVISVLFFFDPT
jgi:Ca2+:H+ antiporter